MGLESEVGDEGGQHLGVLPVHLHVEEAPVETDGGQESRQGGVVEEESVATETR